jgi:hypothetical protein
VDNRTTGHRHGAPTSAPRARPWGGLQFHGLWRGAAKRPSVTASVNDFEQDPVSRALVNGCVPTGPGFGAQTPKTPKGKELRAAASGQSSTGHGQERAGSRAILAGWPRSLLWQSESWPGPSWIPKTGRCPPRTHRGPVCFGRGFRRKKLKRPAMPALTTVRPASGGLERRLEVLPRHPVSVYDFQHWRDKPISCHLRHRVPQASSHQPLAPPAADLAEGTGQQ